MLTMETRQMTDELTCQLIQQICCLISQALAACHPFTAFPFARLRIDADASQTQITLHRTLCWNENGPVPVGTWIIPFFRHPCCFCSFGLISAAQWCGMQTTMEILELKRKPG